MTVWQQSHTFKMSESPVLSMRSSVSEMVNSTIRYKVDETRASILAEIIKRDLLEEMIRNAQFHKERLFVEPNSGGRDQSRLTFE